MQFLLLPRNGDNTDEYSRDLSPDDCLSREYSRGRRKEPIMQKVKVFISLITLLLIAATYLNCLAQNTGPYTIDLEEITVTASKVEQEYRHSTQNISILNAEDLKGSGIDDITEILDLLPSVDILEYGSSGSSRSVHTRGASSQQVLTLIDGRPTNTPRDGTTDFNQIPLSIIERIEVLRGPASSIYGANAVGGVINIITKNGKDNRYTEILNKFGSFRTILTSFSHANQINAFDYFLSYDYLTSHGHRDNSDYLSHNVNTKFGYQLNEQNYIGVSSGYYNAEVGTPGLISNLDLNDRQEAFNKYIDVTYKGKIFEQQNILLKVFHNSDRLEFIETPDPIVKDTHHTKIYGIDTQVSQTFFDIFRTAVGFNFQEYRLNSSTSAKHTYNAKGLYAESEIDILNNGSLKFGARWDDYSNFGDRISPSISFHFWLFDTVKLHALAAKSFRVPTFNDLYWPREDWGIFGGVEGNTDLGPEKAISFEAGLSGYLFHKFKTDITLFKTEFKDLIEWVADENWWWRPENINSASIKGAELETEFTLTNSLKANFNYTYLEAKDKNTKNWLIYRPRHLYKTRLIYAPCPKYELGLSAIYKTKRFANKSNTTYLKHYSLVNLNFIYKINTNLQILLEVKNIFDRAFQEERDYPMPGRAFFGGVRASF